jgi:hypothetical protein
MRLKVSLKPALQIFTSPLPLEILSGTPKSSALSPLRLDRSDRGLEAVRS